MKFWYIIAFIEATDIYEFGPYLDKETADKTLKEIVPNLKKVFDPEVPLYEQDLEYRLEER